MFPSTRKKCLAALAAAVVAVGCSTSPSAQQRENLRGEVFAAEQAFAETMAKRDHRAFATFLSDEAVFFAGPEPLRGKQQVIDGWAPFFEGAAAPFSWEPEIVEVLDSGELALSSGPVRNADGDLVARFTSIWRREADRRWRVVFDKGCEVCEATR